MPKHPHRFLAVLFLLGSFPLLAANEDHLFPVSEDLKTDEYFQMLRTYFAGSFQPAVPLRVLVLSSFHNECVVGLRKTSAGFAVFSVESTQLIWSFEILRMYERGASSAEAKSALTGEDFKPVPLEQNEEYLKLKKQLPPDFTRIPAERAFRPVDTTLARRLEALWAEMLAATTPGKKRPGFDGGTYLFSTETPDRHSLEAQIWSPSQGTKCQALTDLAAQMKAFFRRTISKSDLHQSIDTAENLIFPKIRGNP